MSKKDTLGFIASQIVRHERGRRQAADMSWDDTWQRGASSAAQRSFVTVSIGGKYDYPSSFDVDDAVQAAVRGMSDQMLEEEASMLRCDRTAVLLDRTVKAAQKGYWSRWQAERDAANQETT